MKKKKGEKREREKGGERERKIRKTKVTKTAAPDHHGREYLLNNVN